MSKRFYITKEQLNLIRESGASYCVEPEKVRVVEKFLDDNFTRGGINYVGEDGYPTTIAIVAMKGSDGQPLKNMTDKQLFYLLQDKFQKIYGDKTRRDKFLKKVLQDWFYKKISKEGLLSSNMY